MIPLHLLVEIALVIWIVSLQNRLKAIEAFLMKHDNK